ncbi:MAG: DUF2786 domain-containing protein [Candidatus Micrarchaeota archaeon]|nr:DUF2786 domain-containing protein [Candidatus Micrarchaeota archaeon]
MTPELTKVIEKIRLLRQRASGNTNQHELEACVAAANKLIEKWRIDEAMIESVDTSKQEPMTKTVIETGGRRLGWMEVLLDALTETYGGAYYISSHRDTCKYTVCARESDGALIEYYFIMLIEEIDELGTRLCKGKGVRYAASWRLGCASGVASQFRKEVADRKAQLSAGPNSAALVILDKRNEEANAFMHEGIKLGTARAVGRSSDYAAYGAGKAVGQSMNIRRGMNGGGNGPGRLGA